MTWLQRAVSLLVLVWQGLVVLPSATGVMVRLALGRSARERHTLARLKLAMARDPEASAPLRPLEPGLYEVNPLSYGGDPEQLDGPTVLHLLGTAEVAPSPLPGLRALCSAEPALSRCRHVIADTPYGAAAYLGPDEFGTRLDRQIAPELKRNPRGLVLAGLSRGGLVALELGSRFAQHEGTRVGVLALSPPLCGQEPLPRTVALIGALLPGLDILLRQMEVKSVPLALGDAVIRWQYLRNAARVLTELDVDTDEMVQTYGAYLRDADLRHLSLRATREFALLCRVSDAELRQGISAVARRAIHGDSWRGVLLWGEGDVWVDVPASLHRAQKSCEREGVEPGRMELQLLTGWNHAIGRELNPGMPQVASHLLQLCNYVARSELGRSAAGPIKMTDRDGGSEAPDKGVERLG